jgi:glyoxylase-like metal-dependent hydrolase (beta-lactamase superfamily II)
MRVHTVFAGAANAHIVTTERGILVVDAGLPHTTFRIVRKIRALGYAPQDVRLILITHGHIDHAGGARALQRATGAPIALHRADMPLVATPDLKMPPGRTATVNSIGRVVRAFGWAVPLETFTPDVCVEEGQSLREFGLAARVVCTPGHTDGSISVLFDDGTMFVGDAILNLIRVSFPLWWENAAATLASGCKIQSLQPRLCYSGHGRAFGSDELDAFVSKQCQGRG